MRGTCLCLLSRPAAAVAILLALPVHAADTVRAWEETVAIPTYRLGPDTPNPIFYEGRIYQGAKGPIYPYPLTDNLTDEKTPADYKAVFLENRYLRVMVLPELGGRIFEALDKTNGYHFVYRQHVIKPALVGMIGAWISGGVEWNLPHHHRASSFLPVEYTVVENPDGSRTVWVGEIEWRHRLKWSIGMTLRPDRSFLEVTVRLFNRTPLAHSVLYWANLAVHTNEDYQIIFPSDTRIVTHHSKVEFSHWPVSREIYGGADFRSGVDVSWWKNHVKANSMFAWDSTMDFLAGYDHGKQAGTLHVADHNYDPGKKFWTWGRDDHGRMWDELLTDEDGPYLELMTGAWSDNQPDYSWTQPYEVREITEYWYPFRDIGGVKQANVDAAVNLEIEGGRARFGFCVTRPWDEARVTLEAAGRTIFETRTAIAPDKPFVKEVGLPAGVRPEQVTASLAAGGRTLVSYTPVVIEDKPLPEPAKPPPAPESIKTNEELFLTGLRLEQFYNPRVEPYPYYEEILKRDPGDYRANTQLALNYLKRGMYGEAEKHLRRAVERASRNYTRPKDGEALYYLGVALRALGKEPEAADAFHRAAWSFAWRAAANYQLAELACRKREFERALTFLDRSLAMNARNTRAMNLRAAVLRRLGRFGEAEKQLLAAAEIDPLDFFTGNEYYLLLKAKGEEVAADTMLGGFARWIRADVQNCLELAADYGAAGLWDEALDVIARRLARAEDPAKAHPMLHYFRAWYTEQKGGRAEALRYWKDAAAAPMDFCFPFRMEAQQVLRRALEANPNDGRAAYYLGNLLYDHQPEAALEAFALAVKLDPDNRIAWRNLGLARAKAKGDIEGAIQALEKSIEVQPDARVLFELDRFYERAGRPLEERLAMLEKHHRTVLERDDALSREIALLVDLGRYDRALELLKDRHFRRWEGVESVHGLFVDAHIFRGHERFAAKDYRGALADYEAALEYPRNLEEAKSYRDGAYARPYYHIARAHRALGNEAKARDYFSKSIAEADEAFSVRQPTPETMASILYYKGLALRELGRKAEAGQVFSAMIEAAQKTLASGGEVDYYAKFGESGGPESRLAQAHYLIGLALLGRGDAAGARKEFEAALELYPNHRGARRRLRAGPTD